VQESVVVLLLFLGLMFVPGEQVGSGVYVLLALTDRRSRCSESLHIAAAAVAGCIICCTSG
jgi:hypothetical protein